MNQIEPRTAETLKTNLGVSNSEPTAATLARAERDYGVVLDPRTHELDLAQTARLRAAKEVAA